MTASEHGTRIAAPMPWTTRADEDATGAEPVVGRAGSEDHGGEYQGIRVDDPLQPRHVASERHADALQGDIDDRHIQLDDDEALHDAS